MTDTLEKLTKAFEFDESQLHKDFRKTTELNGVQINWEPSLEYSFVQGAKHQRAKDMNLLLPLIAELAEALNGYKSLLDDQVLVRNIDDDHDMMKFMKQGARIAGHLAAHQSIDDKLDALIKKDGV